MIVPILEKFDTVICLFVIIICAGSSASSARSASEGAGEHCPNGGGSPRRDDQIEYAGRNRFLELRYFGNRKSFFSDLLHVRAAGELCGYGHGELSFHRLCIMISSSNEC